LTIHNLSLWYWNIKTERISICRLKRGNGDVGCVNLIGTRASGRARFLCVVLLCGRMLLVLAGHASILDCGRDLGPELLLAGLETAQRAQQVLELVLPARRPHERLDIM
jgi:hypothetical protein